MNIAFEKIPYEDYLAFFKTKTEMTPEDINWLRIQYDYLKEPSWIEGSTYEIFCPTNFSVNKGKYFAIPTGFRCKSDCQQVVCVTRFKMDRAIPITKDMFEKHIIIRGTMDENHCFREGEPFVKLVFQR